MWKTEEIKIARNIFGEKRIIKDNLDYKIIEAYYKVTISNMEKQY